MQRSELMLFLSTLLFGMFAGVYLYYVGWQTNFSLSTGGSDLAQETSVQVIAEQYGNCESTTSGCATFRVSDGGEYRLLYIDSDDSIVRSQTGEVSNRIWNYFVNTLEEKNRSGALEEYPASAPVCTARSSGLRYEVQGAAYGTIVLDECAGLTARTDHLYEALLDISYSIGAY